MRVKHIHDATLYLGDCRDVLPTLGRVRADVSQLAKFRRAGALV